MKKIMMLIVAVALSLGTATAQSENVVDTLLVGGDADGYLRIVQNDSIETVSTDTRSLESPLLWNLDLVESKSRNIISLTARPSVELGMQFVGGADGGKYKTFGSAEARLNLLHFALYLNNSKYWYTLDWGISTNFWFLKKGIMLVGDDDSNLDYAPLPDDAQMKKNSASFLNMVAYDTKFLVHRQLGHYGSLALGVMYNGRINSGYVINSYCDNQDKSRWLMYKGLGRSNWSFRLEHNVDKRCKFYLDYAPWSAFKKGVGPQTSVLTFGVGLNF